MPGRRLALALGLVVAIVGLGQWSGNQPERDSVAAASAELGVAFEGRRIDVGEVTLHVVRAGPGDGPPVLLLHGFPEFWYAWRGPAAALARAGYRVLVPDQRGYNLSDKPPGDAAYRLDQLVRDQLGLLDALGIPAVHLAAQDVGASVAWRLVIDHPERVLRFATIDGAHPLAWRGFESAEDTIDWHRSFVQLPLLPAWSARVANWALITSNLRATAAPGTFPEPVMDQYRSAWDRDAAIHSMAAWMRAPEPPAPVSERRVGVPTLIVLAPDDAYLAGDVVRRSLLFLEDGRLHELEEGTHWVAQEQPERIGRILADFYSR